MDNTFANYHIEERSFVSFVKREIHMEVARAHFSEKQIGEIDIIVSELASNLIKHAGSGQLLYRTMEVTKSESVFEIVCMDKGPGIADLAKMMRDGISTTRTLGQGLGTIKRLSSFSQVYSMPGLGTIVYAKIFSRKKRSPRKKAFDLDVTAVCLKKPRETVCGDGYRIKRTSKEVQIFFGDGLGHGEHAKAALDKAADVFEECQESTPTEIIRRIHEKVRRTRGLVASVAVFDKTHKQWRICSVGNIAVRIYSGIESRNYTSHNGTIGLNIPATLRDTVFPIEKKQHLIMCTDGIRTRWDPAEFPGIFKYDGTIFASALYRDFSRGSDDASVLVAKVN